jgi:hypothetical protein
MLNTVQFVTYIFDIHWISEVGPAPVFIWWVIVAATEWPFPEPFTEWLDTSRSTSHQAPWLSD